MTRIIESDDNGNLVLPRDLLGLPKPHAKYQVNVEGNTLMVSPAEEELRDKEEAEKWVKSFMEWMDEPVPPVPELSDEALRRENMYD